MDYTSSKVAFYIIDQRRNVILRKKYKLFGNDKLGLVTEGDYDWLEITDPAIEDLALIADRTSLDMNAVSLILSSHESNRIEGLTEEDKPLMVILQYPVITKSSFGNFVEYDTDPLIAVLTSDNDSNDLITISKKEPEFLSFISKDTYKTIVDVNSKKDILLLVIYYIARKYNEILTELSLSTQHLENELKKATNNDILYNIMSIQKTVSSFLSSLQNNKKICDKIVNDDNYFSRNKYTQLARLASVEIQEATDLTKHLNYLLEKYSVLISSIVSNNSSEVINVLTKYSLILATESVITGLLGINYTLPFMNIRWAIWVIIVIIIGIGTLMGIHVNHLLKNN